MKKLIFILSVLSFVLFSCTLFTQNTDVIQLLSSYTQKEYNNLSIQQKVWLKYYCDIHRNNQSDPRQSQAVKRGLTLYETFIKSRKQDKKLLEKINSNYKYLKSYSSGLPSYPES